MLDRDDGQKKKILMITPFFSPNIGGVETHLDDLCGYLQKRGHKILVITYKPVRRKASSIEVKNGLIIRRIRWFGYKWFDKLEPYPLLELLYLFPALYLYAFFFTLSNRKNVDTVVTHGLIASLVGMFLKPVLRKRMVATVHTIYYLNEKPLLGKIFALILKPYDKVLFVSEKIRREFMYFGVSSNKTAVLTYWADHARFKPLGKEEVKRELGYGGKFIVLFVGRLVKEKGIDVLVETARISDKNIFYAFITSGTFDEFKRVAGNDIPANVIFVGPVAYSKLHLYYNAADIFVLPSPLREGFSRAVLEAALCGTPVVASNVGCLPEVVDSSIGRLVNPSPKNFTKIIDYYYNHQEELQKLSQTCAEYAQKHFTESNAKLVEESYYA
jgi:glycosyltransferase involved in cell wall biosynthesis